MCIKTEAKSSLTHLWWKAHRAFAGIKKVPFSQLGRSQADRLNVLVERNVMLDLNQCEIIVERFWMLFLKQRENCA